MSADIEQTGPRWAVTERGKRIGHTEQEVRGALEMLAMNGGKATETAKQLTAEGLPIKRSTLAAWRDVQFPRLYMRVRKDLGRDIGEQVAGRALERALQADDAEQAYLREAVAKVGEVEPNHLAKNAAALASAKAQNIEKAQTLRHEPNQIVETRDIGDLVSVLERLKVVKPIDAEAVEIDG